MDATGLLRAPTFGIGEEVFDDKTDFEIDWVLLYDFSQIELPHAIDEYRKLIQHLDARGLQTQVRHGYAITVLVMIRVPRNLLGNEIHLSRVKDWLHGIVHQRPLGDSATVVDADTPAEALRSVYHLVTWTHEQGGAGVTAGLGQWERITASFPPQASAANASLLAEFASKTILSSGDLDEIRALFGEKVAFYYAFIQAYSIFLLVPSTLGVLWYFLVGSYSISFGTMVGLWSIVFVEYWRRQETDLALRWDVKGVQELKVNRPQYVWDKEYVDPTTGEKVRSFSKHSRLLRQALFVPFALLAGIALGTVLVASFLLEAYMTDVYGGPFKEYWIFSFLPTILLSLSLPYITNFLEEVATNLTAFENYRTADEHELAQVQKSFVLNFVTSFLPIILTAYVYVPYGAKLMPPILESIFPASWLASVSFTGSADPRVTVIHIDSSRLKEEVIGLSMMAQLVSFGEENILPYVQRRYKRISRRWAANHHRTKFESSQRETGASTTTTPFVDDPHERKLLSRLRNEADAEPYDVQEDIMEMVVQFGFLTLFSCVWPIMPLGFLLNNWVELRGDFWKLTREARRPPPVRGVGIGACLGALDFLTWLGVMSSAAVLAVYGPARDEGKVDLQLGRVLLAVFVAEQVYLLARFLVSTAFDRIGSEALRAEQRRRYLMRKTYLETFSEEAAGTSKRVRSKTYASERRRTAASPASSAQSGNQGQMPRVDFPLLPDQLNDGHAPAVVADGCATTKASHLSVPSPTTPFPALTPSDVDTPLADLSVHRDAEENLEPQYKTAAAAQFWQGPEETGTDVTEAGVRLIVALKALQHRQSDTPETKKSNQHGVSVTSGNGHPSNVANFEKKD